MVNEWGTGNGAPNWLLWLILMGLIVFAVLGAANGWLE